MSIKLKINGKRREVDVDNDTPLLWVIRDELDLVGTKFGCGVASCGACTVHINGKPQRSCVFPVSAVGEAEITTIEAINSPQPERCRRPGASWMWCSVATVSPGR